MKQTIEVEVPDGWELEPQTEPLVLKHAFYTENAKGTFAHCRIPLQPAWQYPEWLGGAGVAMSADGEWRMYYSKPDKLVDDIYDPPRWVGWFDTDVEGREQCWLDKDCFPLWTPPPCTDWRESWHPNPRA